MILMRKLRVVFMAAAMAAAAIVTPHAYAETAARAERPAAQGQPANAAAPAGAPAAAGGAQSAAAASNASEYILGPNDRVRLIVFGEEQLSGEFAIDEGGRAALPLVGEVQAAGSSVRQFEDAVEAALKRGQYLNDPRVSVEVLNFRPFYILGEVQRPNQYPYTTGLSVLNAVATAGGFSPLADQTRVLIRRAGSEAEVEVPLTPEAVVRPGDTIRIIKGAFYILGEVNNPGEYAFTTGMTLLNAVATAGGFTYRANRRRVFIQHQNATEEESVRLVPNLRIQPGDTIRIGERFF